MLRHKTNLKEFRKTEIILCSSRACIEGSATTGPPPLFSLAQIPMVHHLILGSHGLSGRPDDTRQEMETMKCEGVPSFPHPIEGDTLCLLTLGAIFFPLGSYPDTGEADKYTAVSF